MSSDTLQRGLQQLIDQREIEQLRYRYWYSILDKSPEGIASCFAEDIVLEYGFGVVLEGREAAYKFFQQLLGAKDLIRQVPRGANGLVEFIDESHAKGRWLVEVVALKEGLKTSVRNSVQYFEEYRKIDGEWKLSRMKNDYLVFNTIQLTDSPFAKE